MLAGHDTDAYDGFLKGHAMGCHYLTIDLQALANWPDRVAKPPYSGPPTASFPASVADPDRSDEGSERQGECNPSRE
jgi:hypothetical protein